MASEVVQIVFPYSVTYRAPRKRTHDIEWFRGSMPVMLECLTGEEAPVVCRVRNSARLTDPEDGFDQSIRYRDGFWRPAARGLAVDIARLQAAAGGWIDNPFGHLASPGAYAGRYNDEGWLARLPKLEDVDIKEVYNDERDGTEARLRAIVAGFAVIDGVLHQRCEEPRIVVTRIDRHRVDLSVETDSDYRKTGLGIAFRMDRIKEARAYCASLLRDRRTWRRHRYALGYVPRIETPHPEFLRRDDLVEAVAVKSAAIMKTVHKFVAQLPRPEMLHFLDMREAMERATSATATRSDAEAFCAAYAKLAAWSLTLREMDEKAASEMPYEARNFVRDNGGLLGFWRDFEGGVVPGSLDEEDSLALASLA